MADIATLLVQKEELDRRNVDALNMASYERWVADALEALLRTIEQKTVAAATPVTARKP